MPKHSKFIILFQWWIGLDVMRSTGRGNPASKVKQILVWPTAVGSLFVCECVCVCMCESVCPRS